jgi:hypothetical protein
MRLDVQLTKAGFSVGWDAEISAAAATFTWTDADSKQKRKLVLTRDQGDGVPQSPDEPVQLGLYELDDEKGTWTMLVQDEFPDTASALAVIDQSPWNL